MSDVIIKGMEMPENCNECLICCEHSMLYKAITDRRSPDCPLRPAQEWISVEERLPEPGKFLVIHRFYGHSSIETGSYTNSFHELDEYNFPGNANKRGGWYGYDSEAGYYEDTHVTHWRPLPEPPKEGGNIS